MEKLTREEKKKLQKIRITIGKTIRKYGLLDDGDAVLVGLSGGKDSLSLLENLAFRKNILKENFTLTAAHIMVKNIGYQVDTEYLEMFCKNLSVPLICAETEIDEEKGKRHPCFVCSWFRRKKLFELAGTYQCNKIALGHHRDDAIETLLMNMLYHGSISSLPYDLKMFQGRIRLIRPLMGLWDEDLANYASVLQFKKLKKECPYGDDTRRIAMRNLTTDFQKMHRLAKINLFNSMSQMCPEYLPEGWPRFLEMASGDGAAENAGLTDL